MITPRFSAIAVSIARVIFSPTTDPIDPAKNLKSITAIIAFCPPMVRRPETTASSSLVFSRRIAVFSAYPLNPSGFADTSPASVSSNDPGSASISIRSRDPIKKWCPQCWQTLRFWWSSRLWIIASQSGHLFQRPSGMSSRRSRLRRLGLLKMPMGVVVADRLRGGVVPILWAAI